MAIASWIVELTETWLMAASVLVLIAAPALFVVLSAPYADTHTGSAAEVRDAPTGREALQYNCFCPSAELDAAISERLP